MFHKPVKSGVHLNKCSISTIGCMKCLVALIVLFISLHPLAQVVVWSDENFVVPIQKDVHSYFVYWYPSSPFMQDQYKSEKMLIKKVEVENGREKKMSEFVDKKVSRVTEYLYKYS